MKTRYTAQEMREMALVEESYGWDVVAKMLRQAADDLEREKKYEYAARYSDGHIPAFYYRSKEDVLDGECPFSDEEFVVVRREVGEWQTVC